MHVFISFQTWIFISMLRALDKFAAKTPGKNEIIGAIQPICAMFKPYLEQVFGPLNKVQGSLLVVVGVAVLILVAQSISIAESNASRAKAALKAATKPEGAKAKSS